MSHSNPARWQRQAGGASEDVGGEPVPLIVRKVENGLAADRRKVVQGIMKDEAFKEHRFRGGMIEQLDIV